MKNKTILVTGGAGYIGSNVIYHLLKNNYNVIVCDNLSNSNMFCINQLQKHFKTNIKFYNANICIKKDLIDIFANNKIDQVLHLAGKKYIGESFKEPDAYEYNNVQGTKTLLSVMSKYNVKEIYFASTIAVYGIPQSLPLTTNLQPNPNSPYVQTKLNCEQIIESWQKQNETRLAVIFRFTNPIGARVAPAMLGDTSTSEYLNLVPYLVETISNNKKVSINGNTHPTLDGTTERDYINVKDLANAVFGVVNHNIKTGFYKFIVGSGKTYSVLQILSSIFNEFQKEISYTVNPKRQNDIPTIFADITPLKQTINFKPQNTLKQTIKSQINFYKKYKK